MWIFSVAFQNLFCCFLKQYSLDKNGFHIVRNHELFQSKCVDVMKLLVKHLLSGSPLEGWNYISGHYRENLIMTTGKWTDAIVKQFGLPFLQDFEKKFTDIVVSV